MTANEIQAEHMVEQFLELVLDKDCHKAHGQSRSPITRIKHKPSVSSGVKASSLSGSRQ